MSSPFFDHPILNSPYEYPRRHWELDPSGQPTQRMLERRRRAEFITPIPKPKKRRRAPETQAEMVFDEGKGLSTASQQYDLTSIINEVRSQVDTWRTLSPAQWQVTPETARLLEYRRHHDFSDIRPFFCQLEAVETVIWLTEVAHRLPAGKRLQKHLASANRDANPELDRLALKLATGAGIRCVVSVSMLTEGWDANNATHILGIRAFSTQLLCEQVVGRALRRQSYELNDESLFDAEYADIFDVPFDFTAKPVVAPPSPRPAPSR